ncbi:MAG: amidase family protein, partial [Pseudomonadales bacterium]
DHGGSLRIPACYCGVVGYRASPGVVPHEARTTPQTFYSLQGPMARSVADVALLLSVIAQRTEGAERDPMVFPLDASILAQLESVDLGRLRIAVTADLGGVLVSETVRRAFDRRINWLAGRVALLEKAPIDLRAAPGVDWHLRQDLFVSQYHLDAPQWDAGFNPNVRATYESALRTPMAEIAAARRTQMALYQAFAALFDDFDLVICPGVSVPPFPWTQLNPQEIDGQPVDNYMAWLALTASLTVVGHPVVALPCGIDDHGTPFGIQVVGRMYGDQRLLAAAAALERAFAGDPLMARPAPDVTRLAGLVSECRTRGREVAAGSGITRVTNRKQGN